MSTISAWLISVVGIVILSVLVDIILPSGSTNKFIKTIFSYLIIIVIITPVFGFLSGKKISVDDIFSPTQVEIQENFVATTHRQFLDKAKASIEKSAENAGIRFVEVGLEADVFKPELQITEVSINLKNVVLAPSAQHIDIKTTLVSIVQENINISQEIIKFYE